MSAPFQMWFSPDESVEACEVLTETAERLRNTAEFASMRKELRTELRNAANRIQDFVASAGQPVIDPALLRGMESIAKNNGTSFLIEVLTALERHVTTYNRRKA